MIASDFHQGDLGHELTFHSLQPFRIPQSQYSSTFLAAPSEKGEPKLLDLPYKQQIFYHLVTYPKQLDFFTSSQVCNHKITVQGCEKHQPTYDYHQKRQKNQLQGILFSPLPHPCHHQPKGISHCHQIDHNTQVKYMPIFFSNAVLNPNAMMVKGCNTQVAIIAMFHPNQLYLFADSTLSLLNNLAYICFVFSIKCRLAFCIPYLTLILSQFNTAEVCIARLSLSYLYIFEASNNVQQNSGQSQDQVLVEPFFKLSPKIISSYYLQEQIDDQDAFHSLVLLEQLWKFQTFKNELAIEYKGFVKIDDSISKQKLYLILYSNTQQMKPMKEYQRIPNYLIFVSLIVIIASAITLTLFIFNKPTTAREASYGQDLQSKIDELPSEQTLRKTLSAEITRVEQLFYDLYQRCVKGVHEIASYIFLCHSSLDEFYKKLKGVPHQE